MENLTSNFGTIQTINGINFITYSDGTGTLASPMCMKLSPDEITRITSKVVMALSEESLRNLTKMAESMLSNSKSQLDQVDSILKSSVNRFYEILSNEELSSKFDQVELDIIEEDKEFIESIVVDENLFNTLCEFSEKIGRAHV